MNDEVDLLHAGKYESFLQIYTRTFDGNGQAFPKSEMSLQYLKKEVRDEVDFLHADKHQSFLKVYFNTLGIKVSYKVDIIIINEQLSIIILKLLKVRSL